MAEPTKTPRIFLSYKRNVEPDTPLAAELYNALSERYDVFIDKNMVVGTQWAQKIEEELRKSNYLITLLSQKSIHSEMVKGEIERAHKLAKEHNGYPIILPVRVAFRDAFPYPLNIYLDKINWAVWNDESDTSGLIRELKQALNGGTLTIDRNKKSEILDKGKVEKHIEPSPSAQPVQLEMPEGTMGPESGFYIERPADQVAKDAIKRQGVTITIKAPRQMGKSSLLIRIMQQARERNKRVAYLDFQLFDKSTLNDADVFFRQFCAFLTDELEMEDQIEEYWKGLLGNNQRCTRYVGRYLLKNLNQPLVLAMDEVENMFDTPFRSDFFSMLRNWHNNRATKDVWKKMDLALVTSTEPYQLIENLNQSPFNVGEIIELDDFTKGQVEDLNQRHGSPLNDDKLQELMDLLCGQPYLVRRSLYLISSSRMPVTKLFEMATDDRGPFGDHLRYHLFRLYGQDELIQGFRQAIENNTCPDERVYFRLRGAGLIRRKGTAVLPRCKLYEEYFKEHLNA